MLSYATVPQKTGRRPVSDTGGMTDTSARRSLRWQPDSSANATDSDRQAVTGAEASAQIFPGKHLVSEFHTSPRPLGTQIGSSRCCKVCDQ